MQPLPSTPAPRHWPASLRLALAAGHGCTRVVRNRHHGPLRLQSAFYPEGECAHLYILHPPGGLVSGDHLHLDIEAGSDTRCLVTTPSAGKVYRAASSGEPQRQVTSLRLAAGAQLEWLPQDNIIFNGANGELTLCVELAGDARFFGWEITCLGRPAGNQPFANGGLLQRLELYREGRPWLLERMPLQATPELLRQPWALAGNSVYATAIATVGHLGAAAQLEARELARSLLPEHSGGATLTRDLLIVRLLGDDSETVREQLVALWAALRPPVMERAACRPRIWST